MDAEYQTLTCNGHVSEIAHVLTHTLKFYFLFCIPLKITLLYSISSKQVLLSCKRKCLNCDKKYKSKSGLRRHNKKYNLLIFKYFLLHIQISHELGLFFTQPKKVIRKNTSPSLFGWTTLLEFYLKNSPAVFQIKSLSKEENRNVFFGQLFLDTLRNGLEKRTNTGKTISR